MGSLHRTIYIYKTNPSGRLNSFSLFLQSRIFQNNFSTLNQYSMQLYNTLSAKERAALFEEAGEDRLTLSFYQYAKIGNPELFRNHLFITWDELRCIRTIYVANEGINAQLSVPAKNFKPLKTF